MKDKIEFCADWENYDCDQGLNCSQTSDCKKCICKYCEKSKCKEANEKAK